MCVTYQSCVKQKQGSHNLKETDILIHLKMNVFNSEHCRDKKAGCVAHGLLDATSQAQTSFHTFLRRVDKTTKGMCRNGWWWMFASPRMGSSCFARSHWRHGRGETHHLLQLPEPKREAPVAHTHKLNELLHDFTSEVRYSRGSHKCILL